MRSETVLAKLSARVPPMDMQPGATGRPEVDQCDAAAICAGMPEEWYQAALYDCGNDTKARRDWLRIRLWMAAIERARARKWATTGATIEGREVTLVLSEIALDEFDDPKMVNDAKWGRGAKNKSRWEKMAYRIPVKNKMEWYRKWHSKYEDTFSILSGWRDNAHSFIRKAQWEERA